VSESGAERLYTLLPAIYRQRDLAEGEPLRALLAILESELHTIEGQIDALYEDWFVETCDQRLLPYLGDLLGIADRIDPGLSSSRERPHVANTIAYRRRKGIAAILEHVAQDVTGWGAHAVELFELVGATQYVQHVRLDRGGTVDVRDLAALHRLGGPFDSLAKRVDVRRIVPVDEGADALNGTLLRGKTNIMNVGVFVWRLQSYPVTSSPAAEVSPGRFTFDPRGQNIWLFARPDPIDNLASPANTSNLPLPLDRASFAADLERYRERYSDSPADARPASSDYYGPGRSLFVVRDGRPVPPIEVLSADLSAWEERPPPPFEPSDLPGEQTLAIDVRLGRLRFGGGEPPPTRVVASYCYGFSADIGGGPYDRRQTLAMPSEAAWLGLVSSSDLQAAAVPAAAWNHFDQLQAALDAWAAQLDADPGGRRLGIIQIADNGTYDVHNPIELPAGSSLVLQAADGVRPTVRPAGPLVLRGQGADAAMGLNGLLLAGGLDLSGSLRLNLTHATLTPHGIRYVDGDATNLTVTITSSLVGPIRLPADSVGLTVGGSILDGGSEPAIATSVDGAAPYGPATTIDRTTIFGEAFVTAIPLGSDVIFVDPVRVQRRQVGGLRYSYVPEGSVTPRQYRCQPSMAVEQADGVDVAAILARLRPLFTSRDERQPGYAQLRPGCAEEIRVDGSGGSEMGVFHDLHQPRRQASLAINLIDYLPSGLEAGVFYVT